MRRSFVAVLPLFLLTANLHAVEQVKINEAVKKGGEFLRERFKSGKVNDTSPEHEYGVRALCSLALIESGVRRDEEVLKTSAEWLRSKALLQVNTYDVALGILFLDRYGEPTDIPLIQALGVRLYLSMSSGGAWSYDCVMAFTEKEAKSFLESVSSTPVPKDKERPKADGGDKKTKPENAPLKLHPVVQQLYDDGIKRYPPSGRSTDWDNSNTQFAVIALWISSRNGLKVDDAFELVENNFLTSQSRATGGWGYDPRTVKEGTRNMTCAGLIGMAIGIGRSKANTPARPKAKTGEDEKKKKKAPEIPTDPRMISVAAGANFLANSIKESAPKPSDNWYYYTLWCFERVGVIYGWDKFGEWKWYDTCAEQLMVAQAKEGYWPGTGHESPSIATAFAILFLTRSNYVPDLATKLKGEFRDGADTEMRGTKADPNKPNAVGGNTIPGMDGPTTQRKADPKAENPILPKVGGLDAIADALVESTDATLFEAKLNEVRDAKGQENTLGLVHAIGRLEDERKAQAREALAERLSRMTGATLRTMLKDKDAELRRGACLACGMKDDQSHIPDLIDRVTDQSSLVHRAARASLKSLTNQDFGPPADADEIAKAKAKADWRRWWESQPKH